MRLLVVEDELEMREALVRRFSRQGDAAHEAATLAAAEQHLAEQTFDVIILDRGMAGQDATEALAAWRKAGLVTPVLMLTAMHEVRDRVEGFEAGADDYLGKPFAMAELMLRVGALARRANDHVPVHLEEGGLHLDTARREVRRDGVRLVLRAKEYAVLQWLMRRRGRVVTRQALRDACWADDAAGSNVEESVIAGLRRKLGPPALIHTVRGHGYIFETRAADER
ncbi:MAG: response regulator transcription factor [Myxococcota bacterium]